MVEALADAWHKVVGGGATLARCEYVGMCRRLYLATKLKAGEANVNACEARVAIERDWEVRPHPAQPLLRPHPVHPLLGA